MKRWLVGPDAVNALLEDVERAVRAALYREGISLHGMQTAQNMILSFRELDGDQELEEVSVVAADATIAVAGVVAPAGAIAGSPTGSSSPAARQTLITPPEA